jgi:hypothetical protein
LPQTTKKREIEEEFQDWGEAIDISNFHGRTKEIQLLKVGSSVKRDKRQDCVDVKENPATERKVEYRTLMN